MERVRIRSGASRTAAASLVLIASLWMSGRAQAASTPVTIQNFAFGPATVTVPVGTTIIWTNRDPEAHTATSDDSSAVPWDSGTLNPGQTFAFTFSSAGTFSYHCAIHPYMTGTIVVQGARPTATSLPPTVPPTATTVPTVPAVPTVITSPTVPTLTPTVTATSTPTATSTSTPTATSTPVPTKSPTGNKRVKTISARPKGQTFVFSPVSTTVKVGTRVTWVNQSAAPHTVTSKTRSWRFNKGLSRSAISFTFKKPGTYLYHCTFHPGMNGKIVVKK